MFDFQKLFEQVRNRGISIEHWPSWLSRELSTASATPADNEDEEWSYCRVAICNDAWTRHQQYLYSNDGINQVVSRTNKKIFIISRRQHRWPRDPWKSEMVTHIFYKAQVYFINSFQRSCLVGRMRANTLLAFKSYSSSWSLLSNFCEPQEISNFHAFLLYIGHVTSSAKSSWRKWVKISSTSWFLAPLNEMIRLQQRFF